MAQLDLLWDPPAILGAAVAALVASGCMWAIWLSRPLRPRTPLGIALLMAVSVAIVTLLFTVSQVAAAFWVNDPGAIRIASRQGLWFVMAGFFGLGMYILLRIKGGHV